MTHSYNIKKMDVIFTDTRLCEQVEQGGGAMVPEPVPDTPPLGLCQAGQNAARRHLPFSWWVSLLLPFISAVIRIPNFLGPSGFFIICKDPASDLNLLICKEKT
jgi:hypothetical protein